MPSKPWPILTGHRLSHEGVGLAPVFPLESHHPAMVDGAIDEHDGHVGVAEDPASPAELYYRGVDDALGLVRIGYNMQQEPAALLVDDGQRGLADY